MVGTTISHYKIESELGQGGMGIVYRAKDTMLERTVALKFLPPMFSKDEDAKKRFLHEARAVSALDHPNVAVVHEIGTGDSGEMFIVMAFYEGQTLEDIIADGPVSLEDAVRYVKESAQGLASAHGKGIIHRDIKPGKRPFDGPYDAAILYAAANEDHTTVKAWRDDAPDHLVAIVDKLLQKKPEKRYQSAEELIEDLDNATAPRAETSSMGPAQQQSGMMQPGMPQQQSGMMQPGMYQHPSGMYPYPHQSGMGQPYDPSMASGMGPAHGMSTGMYPHPMQPKSVSAKTLIIIAATAVVVGGGGFAAWSMMGSGGDTPPTTSQTLTGREAARKYVDDAAEKLRAGDYTMALIDLERSIEADPKYVPAWTSLAGVYYQLSDFDNAIRAARTAIDLDADLPGPYYNLGLSLAEQGDLQGAFEALDKATTSKPDFTQAFSAWADMLIEAGRPEDAMIVLEKGSETASQQLRFIIYKNQGKAMLAMDKVLEAINYLESSIRLNPDWPETNLLLARSYDQIGDAAQATPLWERLLELENDPVIRAEARQRLGQ